MQGHAGRAAPGVVVRGAVSSARLARGERREEGEEVQELRGLRALRLQGGISRAS